MGGGDGEDAGVKGMMDLSTFIDKAQSECLNEDDDHPYSHCLTSGGGFLQSDCDEQLILALSFNQGVKIHSIKLKAPADKGPKTLRIFMNQPILLILTRRTQWWPRRTSPSTLSSWTGL